jgi:hypothetical protein
MAQLQALRVGRRLNEPYEAVIEAKLPYVRAMRAQDADTELQERALAQEMSIAKQTAADQRAFYDWQRGQQKKADELAKMNLGVTAGLGLLGTALDSDAVGGWASSAMGSVGDWLEKGFDSVVDTIGGLF